MEKAKHSPLSPVCVIAWETLITGLVIFMFPGLHGIMHAFGGT
jgi:hypothetical protein